MNRYEMTFTPERERLDMLDSAIWNYVFTMMDSEIDLSGEDAGRLAAAASQAFRAEYIRLMTEG